MAFRQYPPMIPSQPVLFLFATLLVLPALAQAPERRVPVEGGPVRIGAIERTVQAVGTLKSNEGVILKPEVPGLVSMVTGNEGPFVKKGNILVQLDDRILAAEAEQVTARFELSRQNLERAEDLARKGAGTDRALDEARATHRLNAAAMNLARARHDQTRITAPFD
ncbi:MAG: biotin/lipoyl-binding protein, partial [Alphaproteobacteria bacterium]|nr:biotin/lipoyl-binding protein [Alphaproteobacteria bacterium]